MRKLRTVNGFVYFFSEDAYESLTSAYNPSEEELMRYASAVIDINKCEVVKTRYTLEDVFTEALKGK